MIKHIEGTRPGDRVTQNTPEKSVYQLLVRVKFSNGQFIPISETRIVITPGPLPWHHRAWNWIAERISK
jgi:hypothetical protein